MIAKNIPHSCSVSVENRYFSSSCGESVWVNRVLLLLCGWWHYVHINTRITFTDKLNLQEDTAVLTHPELERFVRARIPVCASTDVRIVPGICLSAWRHTTRYTHFLVLLEIPMEFEARYGILVRNGEIIVPSFLQSVACIELLGVLRIYYTRSVDCILMCVASF